MKNSEFEDIFTPLDITVDYGGNFLDLFNKKIKLQKEYFLKNFKKDVNLKFKVFEKLGYSYLLTTQDNLENLDKILKNPYFIELFKSSDLYLDGICKIILVYSNSSEYFLENLALEHKKNEKKLEKLEKNYTDLKNNQINILDVHDWLNKKLDNGLHLAIEKLIEDNSINCNIDAGLIKEKIKKELIIFSNADTLFYDYFSDAQYLVDVRNPLILREKNLRINYFVRELKNTFNLEISNQIICELTSTIFNRQLDETGIKNILKNANTHPINTQMMAQITVSDENNIVEHFKFIDKF